MKRRTHDQDARTLGATLILSFCLCVCVIWLQGCGRKDSGRPPYAPRETLDRFRIDERFTIELFAAEPLLDGPVAVAFDEKGRVFVLESSVFPPKTSDRSVVKRLEDTNGDGKPDRSVPLPSDLDPPPILANWREHRDRALDPEGHSFVTRPQSHVLYQAAGSDPCNISDHGESAIIFPITENPIYPVLTEADRTTSTCGIAYYSNPALPGFERALFTAEPVHNLVHCDLLAGDGKTFVARRAREQAEFLASTDAWFRPVSITVGPDGALYVVDYYAPLAGPTDVLEVGIKPPDYLCRTSGKGRIYRITRRPGKDILTAPSVTVGPGPPLDSAAGSATIKLPCDASALETMIADPRVTGIAQAAAVKALGELPGRGAATFVLSKWRALTTAPRREAMEALFKNSLRLGLLLDALEKEMIPLWCLDDEHRIRVLTGDDRQLADRMRRLLEARDPGRNSMVRKYEAALGKQGSKEAGEMVYKRLCGRCHTFRGGGNYGPDLWAVSSRPPRQILIDILLPSNAIAPGRELFSIDLKSGGSVDGVIGSQTETSIIILHDESRQETVLREDILRLLMSDFSAMPVDLASQITVQEMANLLRFLTTR